MQVEKLRRTGPGSRAGPDHPSWRMLLDAGQALAESSSLAGIAISDVTAKAGLAKGTFYVHFAGRNDYLIALFSDVCAHIEERVVAAARLREPGLPRLTAGITELLEACIQTPGARTLLVESRHDPVLGPEAASALVRVGAAIEAELEHAGWQSLVPESALLIGLAVGDLLAMEAREGHRLARMRAALMQMLRRPSSH